MEKIIEKYKDKKILIMGLGLQGSGVGLVQFFHKIGARVGVTDLKSEKDLEPSINAIAEIPLEKATYGAHKMDDFMWADIIIKGPSVRWDSEYIQSAIKANIEIEMEASLFARYCPAKIIGVTGTRGKSTTSAMIYEILKDKNKTFLCGNVPNISTINLLFEIKPTDYVVMELSSWQLSGFYRDKISPHISVFTNLYPDHMNYYANEAAYLEDKKAIYLFQNPDDYFFANSDLSKYISTDVVNSKLTYFTNDDWHHALKLVGAHNNANAMAAYLVAQALGLGRDEIISKLAAFEGLPYRLQKIAKINGVDIYNDTTSTTPVATEKAIAAFDGKKILLMLGGRSKSLPHEDLLFQINDKVEKIVLLPGSFTSEILPKLRRELLINNIPADRLEDSVKLALDNAAGCDVILFSPGGTSFTNFKNEFHRGEEFNRIIADYEKTDPTQLKQTLA